MDESLEGHKLPKLQEEKNRMTEHKEKSWIGY